MKALAGYCVHPASPCLDTGVNINASGGQDLMGVEIPAGTTIIGALGLDLLQLPPSFYPSDSDSKIKRF